MRRLTFESMETTQTNYMYTMDGRAQRGSLPFVFTAYCERGNIRLHSVGRYVFLFVLQGCLKCKFPSDMREIAAGNLVVVDKMHMRYGWCDCGTVLLEYVPPERLARILHTCAVAYQADCSDIVKIAPRLNEWCWRLLAEFDIEIPRDSLFYNERCRQLSSLLLHYRPEKLGNINVPLRACSMRSGACNNCLTEDTEAPLEAEPVMP